MPGNQRPKKTPEQKQALLALFAIEKYPRHARCEQIAKELNLSEHSVWIWWQEERRKQRLSEPGYTPRKVVNKTLDQKMFLKAQLAVNNRPSDARCEEIAAEIGLTKSTVQNWFTSERHKRSQVPLAPMHEPALPRIQAVEPWAAAELYHYNVLNDIRLEIEVLNDEVNYIKAIPIQYRSDHNNQVLQYWYQIHARRIEAQTQMDQATKKKTEAERVLMLNA